MKRQGFTLLEVLVATLIMAVAVSGLLSNISTSLNNASRLTDYDRAALLAKRQMAELLLDPDLPMLVPVEGQFDPVLTGLNGGWRARATPFDLPPAAVPGNPVLARVELEIWWKSGTRDRTFSLEGYRPALLPPIGAAGEEP